MDDKQYSRQGKFLLYWMTTTSISTLTSFTATRSTANVKFSKNNIDLCQLYDNSLPSTLGSLACTPSGYALSKCGKRK